ncbi:MAG: 50S ribosomal protein L16 [bacterium]|nr:50S ribosomal protein L16 [bacterium]
MLLPKKVKHRKWHVGVIKKTPDHRGTELTFGSYGLKATEAAWITARQIEAARRTMTRLMQRGGRVWIRIFPDKPITSKGSELPMGKGKGAVDHFVAVVRPGRILFELDGLSEKMALEAFELARHKMPVKTKVVTRND